MPLDFDRLAVFPLHPVTAGQCGCGVPNCPTAGKHPMIPYSMLGVAEKQSGPEDCGFGIATGHRSGIFVVDVDVRDDRNGLAALLELGSFPETYTVKTPTGGFHFYFRLPDFPVKTSGNQVAKGVDIRGEGGFVVAPFSLHKNGGMYEALNPEAPITEAPRWLLDLPALRSNGGGSAGAKSESINAPIPITPEDPDWNRRLGLAEKHCQEAPPSIEGAGGSVALLRVCIHLVRRLELPLDVAYDFIDKHFNGRCEPPWSDREMWHKLESARDSSDMIPGVAPEGMFERLGQPTALRDALKNIDALKGEGPPARRVKNPAHEYSYVPSEVPAKSEMTKTCSSELALLLRGGNDEWHNVFQYDVFRQRLIAVDPPMKLDAETKGLSSDDVDGIRMWFQSVGLTPTVEDVRAAIRMAAKANSFHPVLEYLEGCQRTKPGILDHAARCILGTTDPLADTFLRRTLIGAVRRMKRPGTQIDTIMVLHGPQGIRKSTLVRVLFGEGFTRSQMPDLGTKDASQALQGYWAIELAELDKILRSENNTVKEFLSRTSDNFRPPYGKDELEFPRQGVFLGTTNDDAFLRDATGNRRYWPVACNSVDIEWVKANRDALWAEAVYLEAQGEAHWFEREEEAKLDEGREQFVMNDPWHDVIEQYLRGRKKVEVSETYENAICKGMADLSKYGRAEANRVVDTLLRLGCIRKRSHGVRFFEVPERLAALEKVDQAAAFAAKFKN